MKLLTAGSAYYGMFITATGLNEATDADSLPSATATKNGVDDATFVLTVANIDTGRYKISGTVPAYSEGDTVQISVSYAVSSVGMKAVVDEFQIITTISASDITSDIDANSTQLADIKDTIDTNLDTTVSSRLADGDYTEPPSTDDIESALATAHGVGAWGDAGSVLYEKTYTLTDTETGDPVPDIDCWITTDEAGETTIDKIRKTNDAGQVTFRVNLTSGTTVYVWNRYSETPDEEVI